MDAERQEAYRHLLYTVFLHWRAGRSETVGWNPFSWRRAAARLRVNQAIADYFHNLALFAVRNFDQFNEQMFWNDIERLGQRYDSELTERYRQIFNDYISGQAAHA